MVSSLNLWNFPAGMAPEIRQHEACFCLVTCQRTLIVSYEERPFGPTSLPLHERAEGSDAYLFLLETICGFKSKLLGENEIVAQFKDAFQTFTSHPLRDSRLLLILEKLFKDAKDIRTNHMVGLGLKTYASITRRHFTRMKAPEILILGSGQLAEDLINQFKKRCRIVLSARNNTRVRELAQLHGCDVITWDQKHLWENHAFIANTIGFEGVLLNETFFDAWTNNHSHRLMVDLGAPSCLSTALTAGDGLLRLDDILAEGALVEDQKNVRLQLARTAMLDIVERRTRWLEERQRKWQSSPEAMVAPLQSVFS